MRQHPGFGQVNVVPPSKWPAASFFSRYSPPKVSNPVVPFDLLTAKPTRLNYAASCLWNVSLGVTTGINNILMSLISVLQLRSSLFEWRRSSATVNRFNSVELMYSFAVLLLWLAFKHMHRSSSEIQTHIYNYWVISPDKNILCFISWLRQHNAHTVVLLPCSTSQKSCEQIKIVSAFYKWKFCNHAGCENNWNGNIMGCSQPWYLQGCYL